MKMRILLLGFLALMISNSCFAAPPPSADPEDTYCRQVQLQVPSDDLQRGCCSYHSGVCGCKNGRTVCCDGTLSPTCTCN